MTSFTEFVASILMRKLVDEVFPPSGTHSPLLQPTIDEFLKTAVGAIQV